MAKKKNQSNKHRFKYTESPSVPEVTVANGVAQPITKPSMVNVKDSQTDERDFSYVSRDLKRIAILAVALIVIEVSLAYVFNHTGLGVSVDNLIKL